MHLSKRSWIPWRGALALTLLAACGGGDSPSEEEAPVAAAAPAAVKLTEVDSCDPAKHPHPPFNCVFQKGAHNAYWVNNKAVDVCAAGPQERQWDQLLHEHVRSLEWDLHRDLDEPYAPDSVVGRHPGEFRVYHTTEPENSTCFLLEDCLQILQRFDYVLPQHEVTHIALEFKQIDRATFADTVFDDHFHPDELDRVLWEHLGSRLYTPAEFLARCPGHDHNLRECAAYAGWPTVDELRGRYIVTVHGTQNPFTGDSDEGNEKSFRIYAQDDMHRRAAFPMYVITDKVHDADRPQERANHYSNGDSDYIPSWRRALNNTIFFDIESTENTDFNGEHPLYQSFNGIARSTNAHLIDHVIPEGSGSRECSHNNGDPDNFGKWLQIHLDNYIGTSAVDYPTNIVMTDYLSNFVSDYLYRKDADEPWLYSRVDRPFFEEADIRDVPRKYAKSELREPGSRIYFDTAAHVDVADPAGHDVIDDHALPWVADEARPGLGKMVRTAPAPAIEPVEDWEIFPATSMQAHGDGPRNTIAWGSGCFEAGAQTTFGGDMIRVCRTPIPNGERRVDVTVQVYKAGVQVESHDTHVPHHLIQGQTLGDALRIRLERSASGTHVTLYTAAETNPDGSMDWHPYPDGGPWDFAADLKEQGLYQHGDGVFTGTRLNGALLAFSELHPVEEIQGVRAVDAYDLSYCADGSCRGKGLPDHRSFFHAADGGTYVGVHETEGQVFDGQWRTLLTEDRYEMAASGLHQFQRPDKFLLRTDAPDASWQPVYRCIDWNRDLHVYWIDTNPACPNHNAPDGRSGGVIGYIRNAPLDGMQPLFHTRKGTQNATPIGGPNTHDHYFAVGDGEHAAKLGEGYDDVGMIGYVYTPDGVKAQQFDLTALSIDSFIVYDATLPFLSSREVQNLILPPGQYVIQEYSSMFTDVWFTVKEDGTFDYDPSLDQAVHGRGTRKLTVTGFPVTVDATQLSSTRLQPLWFDSTELDSTRPLHLQLPPSPAYAFILGTGQIANFGFGVDAQGHVTLSGTSARVANLVDGDAATLQVTGFPVDVTLHSAYPTWYDYELLGPPRSWPTNTVVHMNLLPLWEGVYTFADDESIIPFVWNIDLEGNVQFDAQYDGMASGRGTKALDMRR